MAPVATALVILVALAGGALAARAVRSDDAAGLAAVSWRPSARAVEQARARALDALFRARAARSADGVLSACERFAGFGDRDVVRACVGVARSLTDPNDAGAGDRLRALTAWLVERQGVQRPGRREP
jgi:hypothetical protein